MMDAVVLCPAAEGMTVTAGGGFGEVCILLDGVPPDLGVEDGGTSLLELRLTRMTGERPLSVQLCKGEFYYTNPDFGICTRPVFLHNLSTGGSDDIFFPQESTGKSDDISSEPGAEATEGDDTHAPEESTVLEDDITCGGETVPAETVRGEAADALPSVYVGCQETPVRDGEYAVRFLFFGSTPVLCGEGGGVLRMEITKTPVVEEAVGKTVLRHEGDWSVCTFYGLRTDRSYTFLIYADEEVIYIGYHNGKYQVLGSSGRPPLSDAGGPLLRSLAHKKESAYSL
jgi:hypothetical protein